MSTEDVKAVVPATSALSAIENKASVEAPRLGDAKLALGEMPILKTYTEAFLRENGIKCTADGKFAIKEVFRLVLREGVSPRSIWDYFIRKNKKNVNAEKFCQFEMHKFPANGRGSGRAVPVATQPEILRLLAQLPQGKALRSEMAQLYARTLNGDRDTEAVYAVKRKEVSSSTRKAALSCFKRSKYADSDSEDGANEVLEMKLALQSRNNEFLQLQLQHSELKNTLVQKELDHQIQLNKSEQQLTVTSKDLEIARQQLEISKRDMIIAVRSAEDEAFARRRAFLGLEPREVVSATVTVKDKHTLMRTVGRAFPEDMARFMSGYGTREFRKAFDARAQALTGNDDSLCLTATGRADANAWAAPVALAELQRAARAVLRLSDAQVAKHFGTRSWARILAGVATVICLRLPRKIRASTEVCLGHLCIYLEAFVKFAQATDTSAFFEQTAHYREVRDLLFAEVVDREQVFLFTLDEPDGLCKKADEIAERQRVARLGDCAESRAFWEERGLPCDFLYG